MHPGDGFLVSITAGRPAPLVPQVVFHRLVALVCLLPSRMLRWLMQQKAQVVSQGWTAQAVPLRRLLRLQPLRPLLMMSEDPQLKTRSSIARILMRTRSNGILNCTNFETIGYFLGVYLYVVDPQPLGPVDFVAYIILAQNQLPDCATVLISSTLPGENPWDPAHRVIKLPQLVDHHLLIHEGGLMNMCPPINYGLRCQSWPGAQELTDGRLFLASSGDGFLIAASEPMRESTVLYEDSSLPIHRLFARVSSLMTQLTVMVVQAFSVAPPEGEDDDTVVRLPSGDSSCLEGDGRCLDDVEFGAQLRSALTSSQRSIPALSECSARSPEESVHEPHLRAHQLHPLHDVPNGTSQTAHALARPAAYRHPAVANKIELYIDGSTATGTAAWSLVVVKYDSFGCPTFCGCCAAPVDTCPSSSNWIGAEWADNISAELSAVVAAQVLALALHPSSVFVIRPDLQLSVLLSTDQCKCKVHPLLTQIVQWLGAAFHQQGGMFQEVRSHQGNPWNELADRLASFSASHHREVGQFSLAVCNDMVSTNSIAWAWTQLYPNSFLRCLPPSEDGTTWQIQPSYREVTSLPSPAIGTSQYAWFAITVVSATCLLLMGLKLLVIPRQETESCVWFHRTLPWLQLEDGRVLTIEDAKLLVAYADPRRLIVNVSLAQFSFSFVVLHVRSAVRTDQAAFYDALIDELATAGDLSIFKVVYGTLRRLGGRKSAGSGQSRALPFLKDHSGQVVTTFAQQQLLWMSQFCKLEAGQPMSWDSLRSMHGPGLGLDPTVLNPDVIPTVADFMSTLSKLKGGKAAGPNQLPPEICQIGSAVFAQHLAPIALKAACHGKEPLLWRGGKLAFVVQCPALEPLKMKLMSCWPLRSMMQHSMAFHDPHAALLLRDLFCNTFFTVDGVQFPCMTSKGTRPGDPVGDILFNMSMRLILKDVTAFICQCTTATWEGSPVSHQDFAHAEEPHAFAWWEIAFVDDCAICIRAEDNTQLLDLVRIATAGMVQSAKRRGLIVNFDQGKSEVLLNLVGPGTCHVKEPIAARGSVIDVEVDKENYPLRSVLAYRHLGTWIQHSGKQQRDVRFRLSLAKQSWRPLVKPFFSKPQIFH
eukprot:s1362_g14.t1